ncbi:hypothetical protein MHM_04700 [Candidatus Mycoplasma haemominutum 'Birmingham 1']|uniref:Uncharacterized protein n=1 Tax=Candidatus Mycoplasma haematominutum 'Birmingham 1' TaxID=1116213 RepID=G8C3U0_9MOLU|nr:hypothetical protein MHM_04700 [Candidatus Mycoplasma haematominutum 'Birmingham 1']
MKFALSPRLWLGGLTLTPIKSTIPIILLSGGGNNRNNRNWANSIPANL